MIQIFNNQGPGRQLRIGKEKGAARTLLLLHDHIDVNHDDVTQYLASVQSSDLSFIDEAYLWIGFPRPNCQEVRRVWPAAEDTTKLQF